MKKRIEQRLIRATISHPPTPVHFQSVQLASFRFHASSFSSPGRVTRIVQKPSSLTRPPRLGQHYEISRHCESQPACPPLPLSSRGRSPTRTTPIPTPLSSSSSQLQLQNTPEAMLSCYPRPSRPHPRPHPQSSPHPPSTRPLSTVRLR